MDFTKFVNLLATRSLFFCRADKFADRWEGVYTAPTLEFLRNSYMRNGETGTSEAFAAYFRRVQMPSYMINCWHLNEQESAAMWRLYCQTTEAIAIRTSVTRLKQCFASTPERIFIGRVKYLDYSKDEMPFGFSGARTGQEKQTYFFPPFFSKRNSFAHEMEVRAVTFQPNPVQAVEVGITVQVDLEVLIERVYVAPGAPDWFVRTARSVIKKFLPEQVEVFASRLDDPPIM